MLIDSSEPKEELRLIKLIVIIMCCCEQVVATRTRTRRIPTGYMYCDTPALLNVEDITLNPPESSLVSSSLIKPDPCSPHSHSTHSMSLQQKVGLSSSRTPLRAMATTVLDCLPLLFSLTAINKTNTSILKECFSTMIIDHCSTDDRSLRIPTTFFSVDPAMLFAILYQMILILDILRNFVCSDPRQPTARAKRILQYLLTWFIIDAINITPWEQLIVQPTFDFNRKKHILVKIIGLLRACPAIRRRWHYLIKARRLAMAFGYRRHLKYARHLPKYLVFFNRMKMILLIRMLQKARWVKRLLADIRMNISA